MGMILMPGGGGGIDLDVVTALAGDVLSGKVIVGPDGEPLTGTLALSGNAAVGDVLSGKTFYSADAKTKLTGTMANRGTLNWSGSNTTKTVDAGYYSGGTLDSRPSYNSGYGAGRAQGQNDVTGSPGSYGLYTKSQYDTNWNNGYNSGYSAGASAKTSKISSGHYTTGTYLNVGFQPNLIILKRDGDKLPVGVFSSVGVGINYMVGPSNSYTENCFATDGSGFSTNNLPSYSNNKYCYYVAVQIV